MSDLPPDLSAFAALLDAQTVPAREAFMYGLCLMMVEVGRMELVRTIPGDKGPIIVFKAFSDDEEFAVPRPQWGEEAEVLMLDALRDILRDEGLL